MLTYEALEPPNISPTLNPAISGCNVGLYVECHSVDNAFIYLLENIL